MYAKGTGNPDWMHNLGKSNIQTKNNKVTLPDLVITTELVQLSDLDRIVYWAYDPDNFYPIISSEKKHLKKSSVNQYLIGENHRYQGYTTVSKEGVLPICKRFFDDYQGHGSSVDPEAQLEYGEVVYFITTGEMIENMKCCYLVPKRKIESDSQNIILK